MAGVLDTVDARTQLVGENRLELLMFRLQRGQLFAINVFKVQEVQQMPKLTLLPQRHHVVRGVTHVRGETIPVIDLSLAIGMPAIEDTDQCNIIIAEYNMSVQAFMVNGVDRIVNMNWDEIMPPPKGAGRNHFLTAITKIDNKLVEIIDVEKVLAQVNQYKTDVDDGVLDENIQDMAAGMEVLLVDDSSVGLTQAKETLEVLGLKVTTATDGAKGLAQLQKWTAEGHAITEKLVMMVTDAEMPEMDGYRLTAECRSDPKLKDLYIVLHTSLSGNFNKTMVEKVGCNDFLSKFQPNELAMRAQQRIKDVYLTRKKS